jgi:hypothetical protein
VAERWLNSDAIGGGNKVSLEKIAKAIFNVSLAKIVKAIFNVSLMKIALGFC